MKGVFANLFEEYHSYLDSLIEKIRFYKTELSVYKDPKKLKSLTDQDIQRVYKQIQKVYKNYQEEKIRRNVMKDLNAEVELEKFEEDSTENMKLEE